jgi:glycosyltransferase involved in cell wall biosynthesis
MATYNGEKFLREQLNSILSQTFTKWHLLIRDDNSSDNSFLIVQEYKKTYPEKITVIEDKKGRLGFIQNFNEILKYTTANYIALCDQDDMWLPDKLAKLMETMILAEKNSTDRAVLVYTDFSYINTDGEIISSTFYKTKNKNHGLYNANIIRALFYGTVVGCTLYFNRKLLHLSGEIPNEFPLGHDYWFLFIALLTGKIVFLDEITIYRRIHENNLSGVQKMFPKRKRKITIVNSRRISERISTAKFLLNKMDEYKITSYYKPNLKELSELEAVSFTRRNRFYFKNKLFCSNPFNSLYLYINIVFYHR